MYEGDGLDKTGNDKLDHEILRWFNNRMIELVDLYIDIGDDSGWDEYYLMECFPRNFVEDNPALCKRIVLDIKDILESDIIYTNMRLLYKYLVSKKFALLKKPMNPSRFRTHPAAPELFALCIIPAVFLKGGKNVSADSA